MGNGGTVQREQQGVVQLGDLIAPASWTAGPVLAICFPWRSLSKAQQKAIEHLKHCPGPLALALDGARSASEYHIIGYESDSASVTFHVSCAVRSVATAGRV